MKTKVSKDTGILTTRKLKKGHISTEVILQESPKKQRKLSTAVLTSLRCEKFYGGMFSVLVGVSCRIRFVEIVFCVRLFSFPYAVCWKPLSMQTFVFSGFCGFLQNHFYPYARFRFCSCAQENLYPCEFIKIFKCFERKTTVTQMPPSRLSLEHASLNYTISIPNNF